MQEPTPEAAFASQLRAARIAAGWSQAQLAAVLSERYGIHLDSTAITRMEKGNRLIRLNEARALGHLLPINLDDLAVRRGDPDTIEGALSSVLVEISAWSARQSVHLSEIADRIADISRRLDQERADDGTLPLELELARAEFVRSFLGLPIMEAIASFLQVLKKLEAIDRRNLPGHDPDHVFDYRA